MKVVLSIVALFALSLALRGESQAVDNLIGVYSDISATTVSVPGSGPMTCYVIASSLSDVIGVGGFQFELGADNGAYMYSESYPVNVLNFEPFPRHFIGCATPVVPISGHAVLLQFSLYASGAGSIYIYSLDPDKPAAYIGAASGAYIPFEYKYGGPTERVFSYGGAPAPVANTSSGVVAVQFREWGSVKALFR